MVSVVLFIGSLPYVINQRNKARGIHAANQVWGEHSVLYKWPLGETKIGKLWITHHVDRETGLFVKTRTKTEFRDAFNNQIQNLVQKHGPPDYSIKEIIPTDAEIQNAYVSNESTRIEIFPCQLTPAIKLEFDRALSITTKSSTHSKGMEMGVDYDQPVYTLRNGKIIYIRLGNEWMGVFHEDGRLIFSVNQY